MFLYKFLKAVLSVILRIIFRIQVIDKKDFSNNEEPLIICSNHINALDPIILAINFDRHINFMAKKELFNKKLVGRFLTRLGAFPIDREELDMKSIRYSMNLLKENKVLGIFPEGTRVKKVDSSNMKEGIGLMASRTNANILPIYLETEYKLFKPIKMYYRPIIEIEDYKELNNKDKIHQITEDTYKSIYNLEVTDGNNNSK